MYFYVHFIAEIEFGPTYVPTSLENGATTTMTITIKTWWT